MPNDTPTTSEQADEPSNALSVLDFLYHDSRRIGSFLAQFEGDGHLQQLTRTKDASRGKNQDVKNSGSVNVKLFAGSRDSSVETTLLSAEGYARVFDPYWANARAFLNHLSEADMLNRQLQEASLGQFVLVTGYLSVLDLAIMKEAWKLPSVQKKVYGQPEKKLSQMTAAEKADFHKRKEDTELTLDMMKIMPHAVHASLITNDPDNAAMAWGTLREEYLVHPASDVTLAYGAMLPGIWSIVGILTAFPEDGVPEFTGDLDQEGIGIMNSMVGAVSKLLAPIVRFTLGRPAAAHAVTPLLIFREVT